MDESESPDLALFKRHLGSAEYGYGEDSGWWAAQTEPPSETWPFCQFWVSTHERVIAGGKLGLNIELSDYPSQAPTGCPWNLEEGCRLPNDEWPESNGIQNIKAIFNPGWENGVALYAPWDRAGLKTHPNWKQKHPDTSWKASFKITDYLRFTHQILNPKKL